MFFITQHYLRGLFYVLFLLFSSSIFAQFSLKVNETNANYSVGEMVGFTLNSSQSGTATYKFKYDNLAPVIATGSIYVQANSPTIIPFQGTSAEVVLCEVSLNGVTKTTAAVFDSKDIELFSEEPSNFDQFWNNQKNLSSAIPLDPQLTFLSTNSGVTNYRINLANINNRRIYGYISVPNSGNNFPAIISLPPYGSSTNTVNPANFIASQANVLSVVISVHNTEPDQVDPLAYEPNIINDPNNYYYKYAILGTLRMIDYLHTRSDFDGQNLGLTGVSQGGGLAIIAAGLDERVKSLTISNPAMCRHGAYDEGRASGFPYYLQRSEVLENDAAHYSQTSYASPYYDAAYFARRYTGPTLAVVSYADDITPAASSFAALNELRGKKIIVHAKDLEHAHPDEYWSGRFDLWRHEFPTTIQQPYFTDTGYWSEAGDDRTTTTNTNSNLNGQVFVNGVNNYNFPVQWDVVDAPGNVTFNNRNVANPTVQFDTPGRYLLSFTAYDYGTLMSDGIFHEISDFMYVEVEEDAQGSDTTKPSCQLNFAGFNSNGSFRVSASFSEPVTGLTATDFQIINGTATSLSGSGANYSLNVLPLVAGNIRTNLPYNKATDMAGNANMPSNYLNTYISNPPSNTNTCQNVTSGGVINGDESNCEPFNPNILGNNSFPTGGTGSLQYQWQSATSLAGNWTNIQNATAATYNPPFLSTTTYFRRLARRAPCDGFTGFSNAIVKEIIEETSPNAPTGYCEVQGDNPNNVWIRKIKLENLSHQSGKEGYGDFTSKSATLASGGLYSIQLTPGNGATTNKWVGWIDYNHDGDFTDAQELIIFKSAYSAVNAFFEVPENAVPGPTRMRIALRGDSFAAPCYSYAEGEVEDYTIILGSEAGSGNETNPPSTSTGTPPTYCTVRGTQPWWQWISKVQFSDLDHSSSKDKYGQFTDKFANVETGNTYELTLTPDFSWLSYDMKWKVWIDFNQDGDFNDSGELVANGNSDTEINFDVHIPSSATLGTTGMRVAMNIDEIPNACTNVVRGEFEDYSINLRDETSGTGSTPTYCAAKGTQPWWQWISKVQFADLSHSSFKDKYGQFTDRFANVEAGNTYELALTPDFSWLSYDMKWKVWIDFNQDGDFYDTGELVASGNSDTKINFDVQIPSSAPAGTTGMRVAMDIYPISSACSNVVRGEIEDYSVVIAESGCNSVGNNRFSPILDLTAQPYEREVELHWSTNTEYKNKNFILEHSVDGLNFEELEEQESVTDGYLPNVYRTKHKFPPLGENIYRVKQIYNSGSHKYSDEKKVFFNVDLEEFTLYPNPSSQKLYLPLQKYAGQTAHVKIYNTFAQLLRTSVVNSLSIEPEEIDVSDLQDGIYYISIEIAGQRTISRAFTVFRI